MIHNIFFKYLLENRKKNEVGPMNQFRWMEMKTDILHLSRNKGVIYISICAIFPPPLSYPSLSTSTYVPAAIAGSEMNLHLVLTDN